MSWWPALLGWPAVAVSVVMAALGIARRNEFLVFGAIVPIIPFGFYIVGSPLYWWVPLLALVLLISIGLGIRLRRKKK